MQSLKLGNNQRMHAQCVHASRGMRCMQMGSNKGAHLTLTLAALLHGSIAQAGLGTANGVLVLTQLPACPGRHNPLGAQHIHEYAKFRYFAMTTCCQCYACPI